MEDSGFWQTYQYVIFIMHNLTQLDYYGIVDLLGVTLNQGTDFENPVLLVEVYNVEVSTHPYS